MKPLTIAIDGPAASGKSTLGFYLAQQLNYLYLDSGVLYRAVTWAVLQHHISVQDEVAVTCLSQVRHIDILPPTVEDGRQYTIHCEGQDITWDIRSPQVNHAVSPISAYPGVRAALTQNMRDIAKRGNIIMVGRDIGTVVLPNADLKLYVTAAVETRARRRHQEMQAKGKSILYEEVLASLRRRDAIDSSRQSAPLKPASDAVIFDTTYLSIAQMLEKASGLVRDYQAMPEESLVCE